METQNVTDMPLEIVQAETKKGEGVPSKGLAMVAFCPLPLSGSNGWPEAQEHVSLTNRALGGPSAA